MSYGTIVGVYSELCSQEDAPSIVDHISDEPYPEKRLVMAYLVHGGFKVAYGMGRVRDCFTDEVFQNGETLRSDGVFCWGDSLAYYVDRYNLRPIEPFVEKAVAANFPNTCNRPTYRCDERRRG